MLVNRRTTNPNDLVYDIQITILSNGINIVFHSKYDVSDPNLANDVYEIDVDRNNVLGARRYDYDLNAVDGIVTVEFVDGNKRPRRPRFIIHL